jgi:hypothetical protein
MSRPHLRRPTPALIVSTISLIIALGGTSYAAFALPKNSVGTKQLKNGSVTSRKIKRGAVGKTQLNLAGVVVPAAVNASHASTADSATNAAHATNADNATTLAGRPFSSFVTTCNDGSIAADGSWQANTLPADPTYVAPNRYGGEGGFACNGATPQMTKEGTGQYQMRFTQDLPNGESYLAFVNPEPEVGTGTVLYGAAGSETVGGHTVWHINFEDQNGAVADPSGEIQVLLVKLSS